MNTRKEKKKERKQFKNWQADSVKHRSINKYIQSETTDRDFKKKTNLWYDQILTDRSEHAKINPKMLVTNLETNRLRNKYEVRK